MLYKCSPLAGVLDGGLGGSQTGDGHAVGGAGHIVQANLVAELHGGGIAAVLAADTQVDVGAGLLAQLGGHGHQLAYAVLIQVGEGIGLIDLLVVVVAQELAGVVAGEAEGHLGQVVGAEGEELGLLGDLVAVRAARGISIMVPTSYFMSIPASLMILSAVATTTSLTYLSSLTSPTRGIMISGTIFQSGCFFWTLMAALMTAVVCISAISG